MNRLKNILLNQHVQSQIFQQVKRGMAQGEFKRVIPFANELDRLSGGVSSESIDLYKENLKTLEKLKNKSLEGGGAKGIDRHVNKNKKILVRERIKRILDEDSPCLEIGQITGFDMPYGEVISGATITVIGKVKGIYCIISANDATVKGGTFFPISVNKSLRTQEIAQMNRLPCIYIPDSGGAYLPLQSEIFPDKKHGGRTFYNQAVMSSKGIHQIALVCGSCTAGGAYNPTMSDETVIVDQIGKIYLGGPPLVKAATGEIVTDEDLGGALLHSSVSGCTDYFAKDEVDAFEICRDIVESLNMTPISPNKSYKEPELNQVPWNELGSKEHLEKEDLYVIIAALLDASAFKEFKSMYGPGLICGTGYIQGMMVGILANYDEIMSAGSQKGSHFMDMCDRRKIPLIFLQNSSPYKAFIYKTHENQNHIKDRAKMSSMIATSNVPKIALTLTSLTEDDNLLMCGPSFNPNFNFMWPSSKMSILSMNNSDETHTEDHILDSFHASFNNVVDGVLLPEEMRNVFGEILRIFQHTSLNQEVTRRAPILRM